MLNEKTYTQKALAEYFPREGKLSNIDGELFSDRKQGVGRVRDMGTDATGNKVVHKIHDDEQFSGSSYLSFNGSTQYASILGTETLHTTDFLHFAMWFRSTEDPNGNRMILSKFSATGDNKSWFLHYHNSSEYFRFVISGNGSSTNTINFSDMTKAAMYDGEWHYISISYQVDTGGGQFQLLRNIDGTITEHTGTSRTFYDNSTIPIALAATDVDGAPAATGNFDIAGLYISTDKHKVGATSGTASKDYPANRLLKQGHTNLNPKVFIPFNDFLNIDDIADVADDGVTSVSLFNSPTFTTSGFDVADKYSHINEKGYNESGGNYTPASLANPNEDIDGTNLEFKGKLAPRAQIVDSPEVVLNGLDQDILFGNDLLFQNKNYSIGFKIKIEADAGNNDYLTDWDNADSLIRLGTSNETLQVRSRTGISPIVFTFPFSLRSGEYIDIILVTRMSDYQTLIYVDGVPNIEGWQVIPTMNDFRITRLSRTDNSIKASIAYFCSWDAALTQKEAQSFKYQIPRESDLSHAYVPSSSDDSFISILDDNNGTVRNAVLPDILGLQDHFHWNFYDGFTSALESNGTNQAIQLNEKLLTSLPTQGDRKFTLSWRVTDTSVDTTRVYFRRVGDGWRVTFNPSTGYLAWTRYGVSPQTTIDWTVSTIKVGDTVTISYNDDHPDYGAAVILWINGVYYDHETLTNLNYSLGSSSAAAIIGGYGDTSITNYEHLPFVDWCWIQNKDVVDADALEIHNDEKSDNYYNVRLKMVDESEGANLVNSGTDAYFGTITNYADSMRKTIPLVLNGVGVQGYKDTRQWNGLNPIQFPDIPSIPSNLRGEKFTLKSLQSLNEVEYNNSFTLFNEPATTLEVRRYFDSRYLDLYNTYKNRVEADGGEILDETLVKKYFKFLVVNEFEDKLDWAISKYSGNKLDGSNLVEKAYNLSNDTSNEESQGSASLRQDANYNFNGSKATSISVQGSGGIIEEVTWVFQLGNVDSLTGYEAIYVDGNGTTSNSFKQVLYRWNNGTYLFGTGENLFTSKQVESGDFGVCVRRGNYAEIWINGISVGSTTSFNATFETLRRHGIGALAQNQQFFNGQIESFFVFNEDLTKYLTVEEIESSLRI